MTRVKIYIIDINYLVYIINTETNNTIKYFDFIKLYEYLTYDIDFDIIRDNKPRVLDIIKDLDILDKYDTIIIRSDPGTGKTYAVNYMVNNSNYQIISISALVSLVKQHLKSFEDVNMKSYEKLYYLSDEDLQNIIIYIDEISSFLLLTHNPTLDNIIKPIYDLLIRLIKKCKKNIISDALINVQCLDLCKLRNCNKTVFIDNTYKKYDNVKAIRIKNKQQLINKLITKCKNNEYFIFASDSLCLNEAKTEDKNNYILITSDSGYKPNDASKEWKNKFVFYSPSIVYGLDFSIDDKQDVFIYIKGKTLSPPLLFQQSTRCRNINNLYYIYDADIEGKYVEYKYKYDNLTHCENIYENCIAVNDNINNVCQIY